MKKLLTVLSLIVVSVLASAQTYTTGVIKIIDSKPKTVKTTITQKVTQKVSSYKAADKNDIAEFTAIRPVAMNRLPKNDATVAALMAVIDGDLSNEKEAKKMADEYLKTINKEFKSVKTIDDLDVIMDQVSLVYVFNNSLSKPNSNISSAANDIVNKVKSTYKKVAKK